MKNSNHERNKKILKIAGIAVVCVGAVMTIIGFISFFSSFGESGMPRLFWCAIVGLPMLGVGGMLCSLGFRREVGSYIKNETVPVINEAGEEIAPAVSAIAKAAKGEAEENVCPYCGKPNEEDANFCRHCGKPLVMTCPVCGEKVKDGDFCDNCGARLK